MGKMNFAVLSLLIVACFGTGYGAEMIDTPLEAMAMLQQYGYINGSDMDNGMPMTEEIGQTSIELFQRMVHIEETGVLDNATMEWMNKPRCGMPDVEPGASDWFHTRKKRYNAVSSWPERDLTWYINRGGNDGFSYDDYRRIMRSALKVWSDVSGLTFQEEQSSNADIQISFGSRSHGDNFPFDGRGQVLAHAFFPGFGSTAIWGDAHFDDDEVYTEGTFQGTNLFQVAAHEFGHSLGLGHSDVMGALMFPYYRGYQPNFQLHQDDINGIRQLYGENIGQPDPIPPTTASTPRSPTRSTSDSSQASVTQNPGMTDPVTTDTPFPGCFAKVTWATTTQSSNSTRNYYLCNATHCNLNNDFQPGSPPGYPRPIGEEFPGLPNDIDASFLYPQNGKTYVFKGSQVWRLTDHVIDSGYPRQIADEFPRLPGNLSAAFIWNVNGKIYIFKGNQYYRISDITVGVDVTPGAPYPRLVSDWWTRGLPDTIDAAFQWRNGRTYWFSGDQYYRLHRRRARLDVNRRNPYPRPTAYYWFDCSPSELVAQPDGAIRSLPSLAMVVSVAALLLLNFM